MKTISKLFLAAFFCMFTGLLTLQAQAPATVDVTTTGGPVTLPLDVFPTVDLVTKGTTVPYLVFPDPLLNPTWSAGADAKNTTGIISTWAWATTIGTNTTIPANRHYMELLITGLVGTSGTISVLETSAAGCSNLPITATKMNVKVVAAPGITAGSVTGPTVCSLTGIEPFPQYSATVVVDGSVITNPGGPAVTVKATLTYTSLITGTPTDLFVDKILSVDATGNISNTDLGTALGALQFSGWGTYNLKITAVSDKISRKDVSPAKGFFTLATPTTAVYSILKPPTTGPIYHLAN